MAYLPTVNEVGDKPTKESASNIIKSINKRMDLSSVNTNNLFSRRLNKKDRVSGSDSTSVSPVSRTENSVSVLNKMYDFLVKDSATKSIDTIKDNIEQNQYDSNARERELTLLHIIPEIMKRNEEDEDKEGILSKLWRYFKYFSYGRMAIRNWDSISKLLGLEKITESIRGISEQLGLTKIIDSIKSTIDDIMQQFTFGKDSIDVPTITGPKTVNGADPAKVKQAMKFFMDKGLTKEQAAGIVGNMLQENPTLDPNKIGDGGKAKGLFQWRGDRQKGMGTTFESQLQHAWDEMTGKSAVKDVGAERALTNVRQTKTEGQAAVAFEKDFERAGTPMMENRVRYAGGAKDLMDEKVEEKPTFKMSSPPPSAFETKSPMENVFSATTKSSATRVSKKEGETGEIGAKENSQIKQTEPPTGVASDSDLKGLSFANHGDKNPLSFEKQITKFQAQKLHELMSKLGLSSLTINSGRRSRAYNSTLDGAAKDSEHINGRATDISTRGMSDEQRIAFVKTATEVGFGGVGIYDTFIHLDTGKVRTWLGKGVKVSSNMQGALFAHQSGRLNQATDTRPGLDEEGELSGNQTSTEFQKGAETKPKSFMEMAVDAYKSQTNLLNTIFSPDAFKQFEQNLMDYTGGIPSKERYRPNMEGVIQQNNYFLNNIEEQKQILQSMSSPSGDLPAMFKDFLNQHRQ